MRYFLSLLLLLTPCLTLQAQSPAALDSLITQINSLPQNKDNLRAYYKTANEIELINPDTSLFFFNKLLERSLQFQDAEYIGKAYNSLAIIQRNKGEYYEAVSNLLKAIDAFQSIGKELHVADMVITIGEIYISAKHYEDAISYHTKALNSYQIHNDTIFTIICLYNIGMSYFEMDNFATAEQYLQKALILAIKAEDQINVNRSYNLLGAYHFKKKQYEAARNNYFHSIKDIDDLPDQNKRIAMAYNNIGECFLYEGKFEEAEEWLLKALKIKKELNDAESTLQTVELLNMVKKKQQPDSVTRIITEGLELANSEREKLKALHVQNAIKLAFEQHALSSKLEASADQHQQTRKILIISVSLLILVSALCIYIFRKWFYLRTVLGKMRDFIRS